MRLFAFGKLPQKGRRKGHVEMYEAGRYLTVTGHRFNGHTALAEITPQLAIVHARIFGAGKSTNPPVDSKPAEPSDLDDAALGKLVKKQIATITKAAEQMDRTTLFSAALLICCGASEANAGKAEFDIEGVTQDGRDFGDWTVIATKKSAN